jgi:hypothetical protein
MTTGSSVLKDGSATLTDTSPTLHTHDSALSLSDRFFLGCGFEKH